MPLRLRGPLLAGLAVLAVEQTRGAAPVPEELLFEVRLRDRTLLSEGMLVLTRDGRRFLPAEELLRSLGYRVEGTPSRGALRASLDRGDELELELSECRVRWRGAEEKKRLSGACRDLIAGEDEIFVDEVLLARVLGTRLSADELKSLLVLDFESPPPVVELRQRERDNEIHNLVRAQQNGDGTVEASDASYEPTLQGPRLFQSAELDVGGGRRKQTQSSFAGDYGVRVRGVDARYAYFASGEGVLSQSWTLSREDPERKMLGPLGLSRIAVGDVYSQNVDLLAPSRRLRGAFLSSFDLQGAFEGRVRSFAGRSFPSWYVELYQNGVLVDAQRASDLGDYLFESVTLYPGTNTLEFRYYGLNGERSSERRVFFQSADAGRRGDFAYQAVLGESLGEPLWVVSQRTQASDALAVSASAVGTGEDRTFGQAQLVGAFRALSWDAAVAAAAGGGWATQMQTLAGWDALRLRLKWQRAFQDFQSPAMPLLGDMPARNLYDASLSLPVWRRPSLGLRAQWLRDDRGSVADDRYRLTQTLAYRGLFVQHDVERASLARRWSGDLLAEKFFGPWSLRGEASYQPGQWEDGRLSLFLRTRDETWTARLSYDRNFVAADTLWTLGASRDLGWARVVASLDTRPGLEDWQLSMGLELSAEREAVSGRWHFAAEDRSQAASLSLLAFEDLDGDGARDEGEPAVDGLRVLINKVEQAESTSREGELYVSPLGPRGDERVEFHALDLLRRSLRPAKRVYTVRSAPGVQRRLEIPLQRIAEVEGYAYAMREGRRASSRFETLRLRRSDGGLNLIARADREGYFIFDEVTAGRYELFCGESERALRGLEVAPALEDFVSLGEIDCPN